MSKDLFSQVKRLLKQNECQRHYLTYANTIFFIGEVSSMVSIEKSSIFNLSNYLEIEGFIHCCDSY